MLVLVLPSLPSDSVVAQDDAVPVLILPTNNAHFLPGTYFDFRVEVHAAEMPTDFTVTVNGTPVSEFFGVEGTNESWQFGSEENPTPAQSMIWRGVLAPVAGEYVVEVTAGGSTTTATWTVREPQPGDAKNITSRFCLSC